MQYYAKILFAVLKGRCAQMAKKCDICGKEKSTGYMISHSNIKTKRKWKPNIHKVKAYINGVPRRVKVCSRCLKAGKIKRAI